VDEHNGCYESTGERLDREPMRYKISAMPCSRAWWMPCANLRSPRLGFAMSIVCGAAHAPRWCAPFGAFV